MLKARSSRVMALGAAAALTMGTGAFAAYRALSPADDSGLAVMTAVNAGEIEESQLAMQRASTPQVQQLAHELAMSHMEALHAQWVAMERMGVDNDLEEALEDGFERMGMGMRETGAATVLPDRPNEGRADVAREAPLGSTRDAERARTQDLRAMTAAGDGRAPNPAAVERDTSTGTPVVPDRPNEGRADVTREAPLGSTRDAERTALEPARERAAAGDGRAPNPVVARDQANRPAVINSSAMARTESGNMAMDHAMMPIDPVMKRDVTTALVANASSRPLVQDHQAAMARLQGMSGMAFDRAFVDRQVMAHQSALANLDNLLPHVRQHGSSTTAAMMENFRASVASHLEMAKRLQASMR